MIKSHAKGGGAVGFNMTPMIDIVFNLIIFFMLVSQFYRLTVEDVQLPPAVKADPFREKIKDYTQVVVNVVPPERGDNVTRVMVDHKVIVASAEGGDVPDWQPLIDLLRARREGAEQKKLKPVNVILRAGQSVPYETIGSVMLCASHAGIRYWWVQAYRPSAKGDQEVKEFLGMANGEGDGS